RSGTLPDGCGDLRVIARRIARPRFVVPLLVVAGVVAAVLVLRTGTTATHESAPPRSHPNPARRRHPATKAHRQARRGDSAGVYAADDENMLAPAARTALARIYVPNSQSGTVDV